MVDVPFFLFGRDPFQTCIEKQMLANSQRLPLRGSHLRGEYLNRELRAEPYDQMHVIDLRSGVLGLENRPDIVATNESVSGCWFQKPGYDRDRGCFA